MNFDRIDPAVERAAVEYIVHSGLGEHFVMSNPHLALSRDEMEGLTYRKFTPDLVPLHSDLLAYLLDETDRSREESVSAESFRNGWKEGCEFMRMVYDENGEL